MTTNKSRKRYRVAAVNIIRCSLIYNNRNKHGILEHMYQLFKNLQNIEEKKNGQLSDQIALRGTKIAEIQSWSNSLKKLYALKLPIFGFFTILALPKTQLKFCKNLSIRNKSRKRRNRNQRV